MEFILGPSSPALGFLRQVPAQFEIHNGVILVGWARQAGVGLLYSALAEYLHNVDVVVGMAGRATSAEALALLRALSRRTFVYHKHHRQTFHPKLYMFDDGGVPPFDAALLVGSSNLTGGGLFQNIEGNLISRLRPSSREEDKAVYNSVVEEVEGLLTSPFCEQIITNERIHELLQDQYISTERALTRKRARESSEAARRAQRRQRPEAPPPPLPHFTLPQLEVSFATADGEETGLELAATGEPPLVIADPTEQFYVRTLTANDVNKLHGLTPGTAEWDIGETARDVAPLFWGWPDKYETVVRRRERLEWKSTGVLRSTSTPGSGVKVDIVLWYREQRPGHAAEHRLRIGPRATLVDATPSDFDTTSLVVLERFPAGRPHTFLVHLLTSHDTEYEDYAQYLRHDRPQHQFGYGP